jgi:hypothetical protein
LFSLAYIAGIADANESGEVIKIGMDKFYMLMTLHGLGMSGLLFSMSFAALVSNQHTICKIEYWIRLFCLYANLIGCCGLAIAGLMGKFAAGWYLLYPLPFKGATWAAWSTGLSIISLIILGVAWLAGILHVIYVLAKEYGGFTNLLGWQYPEWKEVKRELPPIVMITTISLIPGVIAFLAGAVF